MGHEWVSARAVAWVIHDAPVPSDLAFTLTVIAARCDEHGRGSYQATSTIAAKTGKSAKQAQRDIVKLRELGLLLLGDQGLVEHLPPGQRPMVYDVPLSLIGPKPVKESKNKSGAKATSDTPPMDGRGPLDATPPMQGSPTPPMDAPGTPPMDGTQEKPLKNPLNNPSLSAGGLAPAVERENDLDPFTKQLMGEHGATAAEVGAVLSDVRREQRVYSLPAWAASPTGRTDIARRLAELRRTASGPPRFVDLIAQPPCPHGMRGGDQIRPAAGTPACPACRRGVAADVPEGDPPDRDAAMAAVRAALGGRGVCRTRPRTVGGAGYDAGQ